LGEGPLTSAFVPVFTDHLSRGDRPGAEKFFQTFFTSLFTLLSVLVAAGIFLAPQITQLMAWGFKGDPDKFDLTVRLTRIMFPFLLFVCLAAVTSGALNSLGHFFVPSLAPSMLSVAEIAFVLVLMRWWKYPLQGLAVSAVIGGILHFGLLVPLMYKEKIPPRWRWEPGHPEVRRVGLALIPAVWGLSLDQVNAFVDTVCASFLVDGSVTALYNSNRLMQFPLALFGVAMSTAALPSLSQCAARQDWEEMKGTLNLALRLIIVTILPAAIGLVVLGKPIVQLLFEHGRFTHQETLLTNAALAAYCFGLPAFAGVKVLVSAFYSLKDVRTPVRVASYCLLVNIAGNLALMRPWGVGGLAFATTLSSTVNAFALFFLLRKRLGLLGGRRMFRTFLLSLGASAAVVLAAAGIIHGFNGPLIARVLGAVLVAVPLYLFLIKSLKMEEYGHLVGLFKRKK
jgi:putative peptidoglycan lipid II flippase